MRKLAMAALLVLLGGAAHAQAVYRCGNEYRQSPCPGGQEVDVQDPRTAADARRAEAQAARNRRMADDMERARVAQERKVAGPTMTVTGTKPAASAASAPARRAGKPQGRKTAKRKKEPEHFTAVAPPKAHPGAPQRP